MITCSRDLKIESQRATKFCEELGKFQTEIHKDAAEIVDLEQKLLKAVRKHHAARGKYDHGISGIGKQMDESGDRSVAERDALFDRLTLVNGVALQYKKLHSESEDLLRRSVERVKEI